MEGQRNYVGCVIWPFVRYDVLMPKQIKTDLFEWLFLSLVVHQNEQRSLEKTNYSKAVKDEVRRMIKQRFSSLLDDSIIDNIIATAEEEFTVKIVNRFGDERCLKDETFGFLDAYEDLFSSQVSVQRIFQDGICGGVVPCFKESDYIQEAGKNSDKPKLELRIEKKPSQKQIEEAYLTYNRLATNIGDQSDVSDETDEFYDEDAEVDFSPEIQLNETDNSEEASATSTNFSVHFIDNSRCEFNLEIPIYSDGERLYIGTPFDPETTNQWFNRRLNKARSVCEKLDKYLKELEAKYTIKIDKQEGSDQLQIIYRKGVAEQMSVCGDIYRMIEHLPEKYIDLKKLLIDVDKHFTSKHKSYFQSLGEYLECLLYQFVDHSEKNSRQYYDYSQYCSDINYICSMAGVNGRPLMSENIFNNWQKGWSHFKADLAGLFIEDVRMMNNAKLYPSFVQDVFDLYDSRNNGSHYKPGTTYVYEGADITKLFNVTRVFIELI